MNKLLASFCILLCVGFSQSIAATNPRPNIVIFLADDMGFSDIGCFGSEIHTPRIDNLATNGLRYTRFYNTARCSPSRASLLTGLYSWQAGIGHLVEDWPVPGYTPALNRRCVTIAEALRAAGYKTFVTGKWHVGGVTTNQLPCQRGFDRWFGRLINGSATLPDPGGYYANSFYLDNEVVSVPSGGYSEDRYVDHAIEFVSASLDQTNAPFFLYCPFSAPHYPVTDPPEGNTKYRNTYTNGWEFYRQARFQRQQGMGIVSSNWALSAPEHGYVWSDLSATQRDACDLAMARHSAMVENIDSNIGRLVDLLKARGVYTNTVIFFLSDNGASDEGGSGGISDGTHLSAVGANWANTPYRLYKMHTREGGISTPLVVHWPAGITNSGLRWQPGHLIDLMPTCLELAGAPYPTNFHGNPITPLEGRSLVRSFTDTNIEPRLLFFEHEGNRAVRINDWKLVANGRTGPWELYNLNLDSTERTNLTAAYPDLTHSLSNAWEAMSWRVWNSPSPDQNNTLKMRFWPAVADILTGDGDGYAEPGETVDLLVSAIKQGVGPNTGVVGTLISDDPRVQILTSTAAYDDFSPGTATNLTGFRIRIGDEVPPNDSILFTLSFSQNGMPQWSDTFALLVRSFARVSGTVSDLDGSGPIPSAVVSGGWLASSVTDPFGFYNMLLEPGQYTLSVVSPTGYAPTQEIRQVTGSIEKPFALLWTNTGLSIRLDRPSATNISIVTNTTLLLKSTVHNGPFPGAGGFTTAWSQASGPADAFFLSADQPDTPVSFPAPGDYELRLIASAGGLQSTQKVQVHVGAISSDLVDPATNSLNVWLKLDDATGTTVARDSAHTNNSPLLNMDASIAWMNPGRRNGCLTFDGVNDVLHLPNSPDSNTSVNKTRTVCFWFYAENPALPAKQVLFEDGGTTRGMNFYLQNGSLIMGAWNNDATQSGWAGTWFTVPGIEARRWYCAALTLSGGASTTPDALAAFVDGLEVGRGAGSQIWSRGSKNALGAMYDATRFPDGAQNGDGNYFQGRLDDFRIYERVLSASELKGLAGGGPGLPFVRVSGSDIIGHEGLSVPLAVSAEPFGGFREPARFWWETWSYPGPELPVFSEPNAQNIPSLATLPSAGTYGLRLVADTGDIATCGHLTVSAYASFEDWMASNTTLTGAEQDRTSDPDADGYPNWLEYELGTDPASPSSPGNTGTASVRLQPGWLEISLLLRRGATARGLTVGVQGSPQLNPTEWTAVPFDVVGLQDQPDYNFQLLSIRVLLDAPSRTGFFRLCFGMQAP